MKNKKISCKLVAYATLGILMTMGWLVSCQSEPDVTEKTEGIKPLLGPTTETKEITLKEDVTLENGLILPKETKLSKIEGDPFSLRFDLPGSYRYISSSNANGVPEIGGKITCTCTSGSGCNPFTATGPKGTSVGCSMDRSCKTCIQKITSLTPQGNDSSDGDIIDMSTGIHFITQKAELQRTKSPTAAFFKTPAIVNEISDYVTGFQIDNLKDVRTAKTPDELPQNYTLIHLSVYGRVILVPVQRHLLLSANPLINEMLRDTPNGRLTAAKCKCESGTIGCKLNSSGIILVGGAVWCDAGSCKSCSLYF